MNILVRCCALVLFATVAVQSQVQQHVVFVHGLAGFGPTELFGLNYWGFTGVFGSTYQDYLSKFTAKGFIVHYASVGPVSSNHDRACELYAQIKGTKVDYGAAHSAQYSTGSVSHARYGKDYSVAGGGPGGFYPEWDGAHKIHFVGHSMGGNTIRYLEYLLQKGLPAEVTASPTTVSPLFLPPNQKTGGSNWIQTLTTISTPHDGSTLTVVLGNSILDKIKDLLAVVASVASFTGLGSDWGYDFDLGQFGLTRLAGESFSTYYNRVFASPVFANNFADLASMDLRPEWNRAFNAKTQLAYAGTYYFSVATYQTHSSYFDSSYNQVADLDMEALMAVTGALIGKMQNEQCQWKWGWVGIVYVYHKVCWAVPICDADNYCYGDEWEQNDGLVPLRSSRSPRNGIANYVAPSVWDVSAGGQNGENWFKGRWYSMDIQRDHLQIIGFRLNPLEWNAADGCYDAIAETISKLGSSTEASMNAQTVGTPDVEEGEGELIGPIVGGVLGAISLLVLAVVAVIKRRGANGDTTVRVMSGSWASPILLKSSRKAPEVQQQEEQVTSTANPVFQEESKRTEQEFA